MQSEYAFCSGWRMFLWCLLMVGLLTYLLEATPQMPKLSLLVMLDGEATDSESDTFE
jgi:hypothetical protein